MPERERLNIDFGFAPTQVQQRDIGAAYAAPVARKSAKTQMFEGLAQLSGTLLTSYAGYARRQRAEEARMKNLSPELKKELNAHAVNMDKLRDDPEAQEAASKKFYARYVKSDEMGVIVSPYIDQYTQEAAAKRQVSAHFASRLEDPEVVASLQNTNVNLEDWFNKEYASVDFGDNDYKDSAAVQTKVNMIMSQHVSQLSTQRKVKANSEMHNNFQTDLFENLETTSNLNGNYGLALKLQGDKIHSLTMDDGSEDVIAGAEMAVNAFMDDEDWFAADDLLTAMEESRYKGNQTLRDIDPETVTELRAAYDTAHTAFEKAVETKAKNHKIQQKAQLDDISASWIRDLSDDGFKFSSKTIAELRTEYKLEFIENNPNGNATIAEYGAVWDSHLNDLEKTWAALRTAETTSTSASWEDSFYYDVMQDDTTSLAFKKKALENAADSGLVSIDDYRKYNDQIDTDSDASTYITEYRKEYGDTRTSSNRMMKARFGVLSDLNMFEQMMADINTDPKRKLYEHNTAQLIKEDANYRAKQMELAKKLIPGTASYEPQYSIGQMNTDLDTYTKSRIAVFTVGTDGQLEEIEGIIRTPEDVAFFNTLTKLKKNVEAYYEPGADTADQNPEIEAR